MSKLTDEIILAEPLPAKGYRALGDGRRLFLRITPEGTRAWRLKYVAGKQERLASLGKYPDVSIADARRVADELRNQAKAGRDPIAEQRQAKEAEQDRQALTFGKVATEWMEHLTDRKQRTRDKH